MAVHRSTHCTTLHACFLVHSELIDAFLNGPRTLSSDKLSTLIVSEPPIFSSCSGDPLPAGSHALKEEALLRDYELMVCAAHFIGDGLSLHRTCNDLFYMLGGGVDGKPSTLSELEDILQAELEVLHRKVSVHQPLRTRHSSPLTMCEW
jgi:hypothetical protein